MSEQTAAQTTTEAAGSVATDSTGVLEGAEPTQTADTGGVLDDAAEGETGEAKPTETEVADKTAKAEVPEAYEFKMPDGMQLDTALVEAFTPEFKDLGLSQERAQRLVDKFAVLKQAEAKQIEQFYVNMDVEARKLPPEQIGLAKKALQLAPEEAAPIKADIYMRSNPILIKFLSKIGEKAAEPKFRDGAAKVGGSPATIEEAAKGMYDKK